VNVARQQDFEAERDRLRRIATRILSSESEADDVVQEANVRFAGADLRPSREPTDAQREESGEIEDVAAWLTTVVTRLCLDHLRKRQTRSTFESQATPDVTIIDPEADALLAERIGDAMQIVLDTLAPAERAALVLHDVFGYRFDEIGVALGRSVTAVRQLASRARRKVRGHPEPAADEAARVESERVVDAFLAAARGGDLDALMALIAPDAVMQADRAGQVLGAAARYDGAAAVAERLHGARGAAPVLVDGERAAAWIVAGNPKVVFVFHIANGLVREVELIADPDVLATMNVTRARNESGPDLASDSDAHA
jgi:RNA polymerase sigma factor (sigma-70 family)